MLTPARFSAKSVLSRTSHLSFILIEITVVDQPACFPAPGHRIYTGGFGAMAHSGQSVPTLRDLVRIPVVPAGIPRSSRMVIPGSNRVVNDTFAEDFFNVEHVIVCLLS